MLSKRLAYLRKNKEITQEQIANIIGVSRPTYTAYEMGRRQPDYETLQKLADFFGVTIDYLLGRTDAPNPSLPTGAMSLGPMKKIPIIGVIRAGEPLLVRENIIGYEYIPEEFAHNGSDYFFLQVKGDSMINAFIAPGSLVLVRKQECIEDGQIAVVLVNGDEATIKKVKFADSKVMLIPANPNYEPQVYDANEVRIIGRVVSGHIKF